MSHAVVATVSPNGSCSGLLNVGERITYLNGTPIQHTEDIHAYMANTRPNQTLIVQTENRAAIVRLQGNETGRLGIGITEVNSTLVYAGPMTLPQPDLPEKDEEKDFLPSILGVLGSMLLLLAGAFAVSMRSTTFSDKLERIYDWMDRATTSRHFIVLFLVSAITRLVYSIAYLLKFGDHSTNVLELWFYVGVAKGERYFLNALNPTIHILRLFGFISPEETPFYATIACAIILASVVPVLVYILVSDLHGRRAGFMAGLIYGLLVQPVALSTVAFTQHIVQIPLALLFLVFAQRAIHSRGSSRLRYIALLPIIGTLGYLVNVEIFVYFGIAYIMILFYVFRWLLQEKGLDTTKSFGLMILLAALLLVPLHMYFDELAAFSASLTAKEIPGSAEIEMVNAPQAEFVTAVPLPPVVYLRFYGLYLALFPFGILVCMNRKDPLPLLLLLFGFVISLHWTRGSRILDMGVCTLAGLALTYWRKDWSFPLLVFSIPLSVLLVFFLPISHLQFFYLALLPLFLLFLTRMPRQHGSTLALSAGLLFCMGVSTVGLLVIESPQSTQAEYEALRWLGHHVEPEERILTSLDRGHLTHAIAGVRSVSDESASHPEIAKAYFEPEELAAMTLFENNVTYVMVSSDDLQVSLPNGSQPSLDIRGYMTFDMEIDEGEIPLLTAFRLTYPDQNLIFFDQIHIVQNRRTTVRIYRVKTELLGQTFRMSPERRVTVTVIVRNPNESTVKVWLPLSIRRPSGSLVAVDSLAFEMSPLESLTIVHDSNIVPEEGLLLRVDGGKGTVNPQGSIHVSGFAYATASGPYILSYGITPEPIQVEVPTLLGPAVSKFDHALPFLPGQVVRTLSIDGPHWPASDDPVGLPMITEPPSRSIPVEILLSILD